MDRQHIRIGVTGPEKFLRVGWWATRWQLALAGAQGCYLTPATGELPDRLEERFDGFIIGGGDDINPAIYLSESTTVIEHDWGRDAFELAVLDAALERRLPVFGICRGCQLLNVHAGGTLHENLLGLRRHTSQRRTILPGKAVSVNAPSMLRRYLGDGEISVNSLHDQAVKDLGAGMIATAFDLDGIVQAIESTDGTLRLGVQWHPEYLPQRPEQRRLFARFVQHCAASAASRIE
ncbi:MAG: hypothetical protein Hals2KO_07630 [Halioglobus sp.]